MDETTLTAGDPDSHDAADRDSRTPPEQAAEDPADAGESDEWLPL